MSKNHGTVIGFRPSYELRARLEKIAKATDRSKSYIIKKAVEMYVEELEKTEAEKLFFLNNVKNKR